ncbi:MAG: alpha/beta fold hydrolase [Solirubrobacteraceae bacterium]
MSVPLDREDPSAGSVSLAVQRVAASAPRVGTIVVLAGGPGQPALPVFEGALAPLADEPALRGYELVSFDQRGTGQSGALTCPGFFRVGFAALAACGEMLGAARADYTSQDSVEDMEDLRQALGSSPLSLYGTSYGGKVAGMYAREYPEGVARMVLDSPVPLAGSDPLDSQRVRALRRVLDAGICGEGACRAFTRNPYGDLVRLVALLHRHPMPAHILDAQGRRETVSVSESSVYELLSLSDLASDLRALTPAAIAAALKGDHAPLGRLTSELGAPSPGSAAHAAQLAAWSAPGRGWPDRALGDEAATPEPFTRTALSVTLFDATLCDESSLRGRPNRRPRVAPQRCVAGSPNYPLEPPPRSPPTP